VPRRQAQEQAVTARPLEQEWVPPSPLELISPEQQEQLSPKASRRTNL
jgi:hypothetical protein